MDTRTHIILAAELATHGLSIGPTSGEGRAVAEGHPHRRAGRLSRPVRQAKKGPRRARQVPGAVKRLVWTIRVCEHDCLGRRFNTF